MFPNQINENAIAHDSEISEENKRQRIDNIPRKQVAFRIGEKKAQQLQDRVRDEGKSLNTVLERLVDVYLECTATEENNELISSDGSAINDKVEIPEEHQIEYLLTRKEMIEVIESRKEEISHKAIHCESVFDCETLGDLVYQLEILTSLFNNKF